MHDQKTVVHIVFGGKGNWHPASRRMVVGQARIRTEENPSHAGKLYAKIHVLVDRATV